MVAKSTTVAANVLTETAAINMTITRNIQGSLPPVDIYGVNMGYGDAQFITDGNGVKTQLIQQGLNTVWFSLTQEEVGSFMSLQVTPAGATAPISLGAYIGQLMDAQIQVDMAAKAAAALAAAAAVAAH